jgi:hypothetical protein
MQHPKEVYKFYASIRDVTEKPITDTSCCNIVIPDSKKGTVGIYIFPKEKY